MISGTTGHVQSWDPGVGMFSGTTGHVQPWDPGMGMVALCPLDVAGTGHVPQVGPGPRRC